MAPVESQPQVSQHIASPQAPTLAGSASASETEERPVPVQVNLPTVLRSHAGGAKTGVGRRVDRRSRSSTALVGRVSRVCPARSSTMTGHCTSS